MLVDPFEFCLVKSLLFVVLCDLNVSSGERLEAFDKGLEGTSFDIKLKVLRSCIYALDVLGLTCILFVALK